MTILQIFQVDLIAGKTHWIEIETPSFFHGRQPTGEHRQFAVDQAFLSQDSHQSPQMPLHHLQHSNKDRRDVGIRVIAVKILRALFRMIIIL